MEKEQKIVLSRIIASGVLLAASYVSSFPVWLHVVLCATAYFIIGADVICKAIRNLSHGDWFDENFLMTLATIGAFVIGEYPEAVAVMLFYQIGELFSDIAVSRSRSSITALMDIRPDYANLEENDRTLRISPEEVPTGSVIVVKPGEKIPLDGKILSGVSTLDTAALTGESLPREVTEGDAVVSGSLNMTGCCASARRALTENRQSRKFSIWSRMPVRARLLLKKSSPVLLVSTHRSWW